MHPATKQLTFRPAFHVSVPDLVNELLANHRKMIDPPSSDDFQRVVLKKSTDHFLASLDTLHKVVKQALDKPFQQRQGFECGFVSGSLYSLQYNWRKRQKIYQNWMKDSVTLILLHDWSIRRDEAEDPPIVIDFDFPSSRVDDTQSVRLKDMNFLSLLAVYSQVKPNFEYTTSGRPTHVFSIAKPPRLAESLMTRLISTITSSQYRVELSRFMLDEVEHIVCPEFPYPSDHAGYLKNYLAGSFAAEESADRVEISLLEPTSPTYRIAFLLKDLVSGIQLLLNIIDQTVDTFNPGQLPFIGYPIPDAANVPGVSENTIYVLNVFQNTWHATDIYRNPHLDYFHYRVLLSTVDRQLVHLVYRQQPIPKLSLNNELSAVLVNQAPLKSFLEKLAGVMKPISDLIVNRGSLFILFNGLLHYESSMIGVDLASMGDIMFTLFVLNKASHTVDTVPLTIYMRADQPMLHQSHSIPAAQKRRILRMHFENRPDSLRRYTQFYARFDHFGPDTPDPALMNMNC